MTIFNQKIAEEVCYLREEGLPMKSIANIVGIHINTLYSWRDKGKEENAKPQYRKFYLDFMRATAEFERLHLSKIAKHNDWKASRYLLEVTDPSRYNLKHQHQIESNNKTETNLKILSNVLKEGLTEDDDDGDS